MIKVLFLSRGDKPDYMCDMVYHGLMINENIQVEEFNTPHYMYHSFKNKHALYGKGFTMYGHLTRPAINLTRWTLRTRVKRRYYDYIVYGSIQRFDMFFDFISEHYTSDKILVIDGEDENNVETRFLKRSTYFKRELTLVSNEIHPINFAIPQHLVIDTINFKSKKNAHIIPGDRSTYIFDQQDEYYGDYQRSIFGITQKKAGWDCLRHYEILMNGCIPYFIGINNCPAMTMTMFPKEVINETNMLYEQNRDFDYRSYTNELLEHTRKYLTTRQLAESILSL